TVRRLICRRASRRELLSTHGECARVAPRTHPGGSNGQGNWALAQHRFADSHRGARHRLHLGHQDRLQRPLTEPLRPPLLTPSLCPATIPPFSMARWSFPTWVLCAVTSVSAPGGSPRSRTRSRRRTPTWSSTPAAGW